MGFLWGQLEGRQTKMGFRMVEIIPNVHGFITVTSLLLVYANCLQLLQLSRAHDFTLFYS
jgi:hypothetical protein